MNAYYLGRPRRIQRFDFVLRLESTAADDQIVLTPQLAAYFFKGAAHLTRVFLSAEIYHRLIHEWPFMQARVRTDGSFYGCHKIAPRRDL
jgi:hypothetical protein